MVGTRKRARYGSDDELDLESAAKKRAVARTLDKLAIDGSDVLKGGRPSKREVPAVPVSVYHYRGAVYECIPGTNPEWLEKQPKRVKKEEGLLSSSPAVTQRAPRKDSLVDSVTRSGKRRVSAVGSDESTQPPRKRSRHTSTPLPPPTPPPSRPKMVTTRGAKQKATAVGMPHEDSEDEGIIPTIIINEPAARELRRVIEAKRAASKYQTKALPATALSPQPHPMIVPLVPPPRTKQPWVNLDNVKKHEPKVYDFVMSVGKLGILNSKIMKLREDYETMKQNDPGLANFKRVVVAREMKKWRAQRAAHARATSRDEEIDEASEVEIEEEIDVDTTEAATVPFDQHPTRRTLPDHQDYRRKSTYKPEYDGVAKRYDSAASPGTPASSDRPDSADIALENVAAVPSNAKGRRASLAPSQVSRNTSKSNLSSRASTPFPRSQDLREDAELPFGVDHPQAPTTTSRMDLFKTQGTSKKAGQPARSLPKLSENMKVDGRAEHAIHTERQDIESHSSRRRRHKRELAVFDDWDVITPEELAQFSNRPYVLPDDDGVGAEE